MTWTPPDEPVDEQTFKDGLTRLVRTAAENDVPVEHAWDCRTDVERGWDVEIIRLMPQNEQSMD